MELENVKDKTASYYRSKARLLYGKLGTCGCSNPAVLVHHKDGIPKHNELENLVGLCKGCHSLEHPPTQAQRVFVYRLHKRRNKPRP